MDIYHAQQEHQFYNNYHNPANASHQVMNQYPLLAQAQAAQAPAVQQPSYSAPSAQQQAQAQQQMSYLYHEASSYPMVNQQPSYQMMQQYQATSAQQPQPQQQQQQQQQFPQWNSKFLTTGNLVAHQEVPAPPQYQSAMAVTPQQQPQQAQQQGSANLDDTNSDSFNRNGKKSFGNVSPHSQHQALAVLAMQQQFPQAHHQQHPHQAQDEHFQVPAYSGAAVNGASNSVPIASPNSARSLTYPIFGSQPMVPFQSIDQQNLPPLRNSTVNGYITSATAAAQGSVDLGIAAITPSQLSSVSSSSNMTSNSTGHIHVLHKHDSMSSVRKREKKRRNTIDGMSIETAARNRCPTCQKQFKRPSSLKTHMYSHTGEKPFVCLWNGCEKIFSVRSNMIRHLRLHEKKNSKSRYSVGENGNGSGYPLDANGGDTAADHNQQPHILAQHRHSHPNHGEEDEEDEEDEVDEEEEEELMKINNVQGMADLEKSKY